MKNNKVNSGGYLIKRLCLIFALLFISATVSAQSIKVNGIVKDDKEEPLIGVTVKIKGTNQGTITDIEGKYFIAVEKGKILEFSYMGYSTVEKTVTEEELNIYMKEDKQVLDELVVIGYGTQKKSDLTGSLSSISEKDIANSTSANISQVLQGKAAGVYITSNSGSPGSGATIRVRGYGSISTDLTPLYVVDGQPIDESQMNHINPHDIKNVEILKDASASAIYGSRGANGVILITTKQGEVGKTAISFSASFGLSNAINKVKMMDSHQLYNYIKEGYENDGLKMPRNFTRLYTLDGVGLGPNDENGEPTDINIYNTNWWDKTTRTGFRQNYNLSVSGGSEKLKSYFSIGRYAETGILETTDYERITIRLNNEYKYNKYITIGQTLGLAYAKNHDISMPINEILLADPFTPVIAANADKTDPNYEYNKYIGSQYSYYGNPVGVLNRQKREHVSKNVDGTAYIDINLGLEGLYFKTLLGFDVPSYNYYEFNPFFDWRQNDTKYNLNQNQEKKYNLTNSAVNSNTSTLNYSFQNTLSYANTFGKHDISAMFGYTWESRESKWFSARRENMPNNSDSHQIISAGTLNPNASGSRSEDYLISYLGRLNYNFDNKYLLTFSIRHDGSSKFARGNRWGTFPSFSLGWKIDQEKFFKNWKQQAISTMKLRVGWGQNGNQNIPSYAYMTAVGTNELWQYAFNGGQNTQHAYGVNLIGNPNIKWETSEQTNVGLDLSFLNNALTFSGDYYVKKTKDVLMAPPVPSMSGYPNAPWGNVGTIRNKGFEFLVGYKGNAGDFTYEANVNLTFQRNKLIKLQDGDKPIYGSVSKNITGNPFGQFYGYVYDGIFQTPEEIQAHVGADGVTLLQPNAQPGDMRFKNVANDNILNDDDRTFIGDPNPNIIYGGSINLGYKGFDFSLYFQGVAGNDLWVNTKKLYRRTSETNLLAKTYTHAWRQAGDRTDIPRISRQDINDNYRNSSWYVESGAFCKIKNIQLGYTIPSKLIRATKFMQSARVYFSVENAFTISGFEFMDPEVPNGDPKNIGVEDIQYPNPRIIMMGVNVQF